MNNTTDTTQRILIVDDHVLFREGLMGLFRTTDDFIVVDQAGSVQEGIEKAYQYKPDIVLMDFSLPDGTGLDATQAILKEHPDCKIIFLTVYETDENLLAAIRLGAKGYMLKNVSITSLLTSLRALPQGEIAMSRKMMSKVVEFSRSSSALQSTDLLEKLSPRELDVLCELRHGSSNMQISQKLYLSENTVKHHIHSILEKLGVDNRRQAGEIARRAGVRKNKTS